MFTTAGAALRTKGARVCRLGGSAVAGTTCPDVGWAPVRVLSISLPSHQTAAPPAIPDASRLRMKTGSRRLINARLRMGHAFKRRRRRQVKAPHLFQSLLRYRDKSGVDVLTRRDWIRSPVSGRAVLATRPGSLSQPAQSAAPDWSDYLRKRPLWSLISGHRTVSTRPPSAVRLGTHRTSRRAPRAPDTRHLFKPTG